ncbi:MAG: DMT family transporter [Bacteroides sp.]|nr:DMT family transporter [Bacteroides sp.]
MNRNTRAILLALMAVLSWSTVATAFKVALTYLTHFEMLLIASLTSVLVFTLTLTIQGKWHMVRRLSSKLWKELAFQGFLNPAAYYLILFKAYDMLPAQVAQPVNYAWPIVLLILLAAFAKQPIPSKKYMGMVISMLGVVMISLGTGQLSGMEVPFTGVLLAAISAFFWAGYWMVNNKHKDSIDAIVTLFGSFLCGSLYLIICIPVFGFSIPNLNGLLAGIYVGGFEMAIPFICFGIAIRITSNPALINQLCYLSPFLSLFFIAMVLHEPIVVTTYIGLVLIVAGIVFNEYLVKDISKKNRE